MKIHHIQINVKDISASGEFYSKLFSFLGWKEFMSEKDMRSWTNGETSIFLTQCEERYIGKGFHRKAVGLNHIAFEVSSKEKVDEACEFLKENNIEVLYGGAKEYPEYCPGYYAVYFEDPDRIKLEIVFIPKAKV